MAFCEKCGTQIPDGVNVCPSCGASTQTQAQINDVEAHKILAVISYMGMLVVVPLLSGKYKNSPFLRFHTNQAFVLCIGYLVPMLLAFIPSIGAALCSVLILGIAALQILGIISAVKGETKPLPIIKGIKIIK